MWIETHSGYVEINSHMNTALVSVPRRYDLSDWSWVNDELKTVYETF
jgi:hypothetical protein